ncbi:hypothetical protein ACWDDN_13770 [Streptomyces griseoruber]
MSYAVVVHPWWKAPSGRPERGLDFGDVVIADRETMCIRYVRGHSRPFQGRSLKDRIMKGGPRGLTPDVDPEALLRILPEDFDHSEDCVAWFDDLEAAEKCAKALGGARRA